MSLRMSAALCPQIVLDWIAWYPEGDLPSAVRGAIEAHAAECSSCRAEIALVSGEAEPEALPAESAERAFGRVLQKVAAAPRLAAPARVRRMWSVRPPAAIAAGLAIVLLSSGAAIVAVRELGSAGPLFETASSARSPAHAGGAHLEVVFRPEASFANVQAALQDIGATVEAGPTPSGVVHLQLAAGADPRAAAARLESGDAPIALYAQPAP